MKIKFLKSYSHFANKKGILFIIEMLLVLLLILAVLLGLTKINLTNNYDQYYNFLKINDIYTIILGKNIYDADEIKQLIEFYMPYSEYEVISNKLISNNITKNNCLIKNIEIYHEGNKKAILIKICY